MAFWDWINPVPLATKAGKKLLFGTEGKYKELSKLTPGQRPLHDQLVNAGMNQGAGGAFGDAADYYRNNLSDNSADFDAFAAPEMRRFNEQIIPDLAEQFAGAGSGNLSSSAFTNSAVNAGTDLSERLGAIRANLRQQSAAGLANIGQLGLNPVKENIYEAGSPGLLQQAAPALASAAASYFTGVPTPIGGGGGMGGGATAPGATNLSSNGGNQPSYGNGIGFQAPNFNSGMR